MTMAIPVRYSLRSIAVRKGSSAMAVGGIALVVVVFVTLLSLAAGFRRVVEASGSPRNVIVVRKGADAELQSQVLRDAARVVGELPFVAEQSGRRLVVFESVVILARPKQGGGETNVTIRGARARRPRRARGAAADGGPLVYPRLERGRARCGAGRRTPGPGPRPDADDRPEHLAYRRPVRGRPQLAGIRTLDGRQSVTGAFHRDGVFQSVRFRAAGGAGGRGFRQLTALTESDPRLHAVQALTETEYYQKQSQLMSDLITILGGTLTVIMSIGAIAGAMNTMYAAVSQRKREIGCLLAMGFTPEAVWLAFVVESLLLASLGAVLGCAVSLFFNGMKTGMTNWATFSETAFAFLVTPRILATAALLSLAMGFVGGLLPAFRAARMKVVDALRRT